MITEQSLTVSTHTTFDPSAFEELKASVGDGPFLANLITEYIDDARQHLATMRQAIEKRDAALLERTAHTLKSTSETMGAEGLAAISYNIEMLAHDDRLDEAATHVPAATEQFAAVQTALQEQRATLDGEA